MEWMLNSKKAALVMKIFKLGEQAGIIHNYLDQDTDVIGAKFSIADEELINFSSCSYLGFDQDQRVAKAISEAALRYGTSWCMSRTYASHSLYKELENQLEQMFESFPVVTLSTTLASLSFMEVFIDKNDIVILDQYVHESVQLAALTRVGKGTRIETLPHNDMGKLEEMLEKNKCFSGKIWYCADGVYSMGGNFLPRLEITRLLEKYSNFYCYVDDAHSLSVHGKNGRGFVLGKEKQHNKIVVAASFVKAFGMGVGGVIVFPTKELQNYFQVCGPTVRYNTPIPPPMLAGGIELARIHLTPEIAERQNLLMDKIKLFQEELKKHDIVCNSSLLSPIQFVKIGNLEKTICIVKKLKNDGFFTSIAAFPAVPRNANGVRFAINNHLDNSHILEVVSRLKVHMELAMN